MNPLRTGAVVVCVGLVWCSVAPGATLTWFAVSGNWSTPTNWNPIQEPTESDYANIHNNGLAEITPGNSEVCYELSIGAAGNTTSALSITTGSLALAGYWLFVGQHGTGTVIITKGGQLSGGTSKSHLGRWSGASGTVTVKDANSEWTNIGNLYVGHQGAGMLNVENGAHVSSLSGYLGYDSGSTGTATVSGEGSMWTNSRDLNVGSGGAGTLNITNGGQVVSNRDGEIGAWSGPGGAATVDGVGSTWTIGSRLRVGDYPNAPGTLTVLNGGLVSSAYGSEVASSSDSRGTVTVDGVGSTWATSDELYVGKNGDGELTVLNGGQVSNTRGHVGYDGRARGTVTVSGAGSTWTNSDVLYVGRSGHGTLTVQNGGQVSNTTGYLGYGYYAASGTVTVDGAGSTWTNSGWLYVGGNATRAAGTGELTISDQGAVSVGGTLKIWGTGTVNVTGGTLTAATIDDSSGGTFDLTGGRVNAGAFSGNLTNTSGTVSPGSSPGVLTVGGDYVETTLAASVHIEIGGTTQGTQYDLLDVTGQATLMGDLIVELIDDFVPESSDMFTILTADAITGEWANTSTVPVLGGGQFDVTYNHNIGADDTVVLSNYVPEPATLALLALGGLALLKRRRS